MSTPAGSINLRNIEQICSADSGALIFQTPESGVMTERMRITPDGLVGIGTPSPEVVAGVQVAGQVYITFDTSPATTYFAIQNRLGIVDLYGTLHFLDLRYNAGQLAFASNSAALIAVDASDGQSPKAASIEARIYGGNTTKVEVSSNQVIDFFTDDQPRMRVSNLGVEIGPMLLPSVDPGAGSRQMWYDPSDGNIVKYSP